MPKKRDPSELEGILRRRGAQQSANVRESVTEIRSCGVCGEPEPIPPNLKNKLYPLMIMWDFAVDHAQVEALNAFLKQNEPILFTGMPQDSFYLGTYMLCDGGTPKYRTMWAYKSVQHMFEVWSGQVPQNVVDVAAQLRQYWLQDPERREGRYMPGQVMYTGDKPGNPFARMTFGIAAGRVKLKPVPRAPVAKRGPRPPRG